MPAAWAAASASAIWMPHAMAVFSGSGFRPIILSRGWPWTSSMAMKSRSPAFATS